MILRTERTRGDHASAKEGVAFGGPPVQGLELTAVGAAWLGLAKGVRQ